MFCVKCLEHEADKEILRNEIYRLQTEIESLSIDLAFAKGEIKLTENKE